MTATSLHRDAVTARQTSSTMRFANSGPLVRRARLMPTGTTGFVQCLVAGMTLSVAPVKHTADMSTRGSG